VVELELGDVPTRFNGGADHALSDRLYEATATGGDFRVDGGRALAAERARKILQTFVPKRANPFPAGNSSERSCEVTW